MILHWEKHPVNRTLARNLRAFSRHAECDGHRFRYNDLDELWATEDAVHVALRHRNDSVWQYWQQTHEGWRLVSCHADQAQAQDQALTVARPDPPPLVSGTYVVATQGDGRGVRVRCVSRQGATLLTDIFKGLGYETTIETVE